ncbi:hypothetical protein XU18_0849 [Perkinsela sp. CCAP 1560/4]|nr:hypothetical protein XU18_0849 [Perkinsela sp. CCAP 1560/4]|eukprot:KNH08652.1 hypothetical protein XU18_0849 [Perkinsela sp. CCAP 1560/4]
MVSRTKDTATANEKKMLEDTSYLPNCHRIADGRLETPRSSCTTKDRCEGSLKSSILSQKTASALPLQRPSM